MSVDFTGEFDLDSLLYPDQLSLEDERNNSLVVSDYLLNNANTENIDLSAYKTTITIDIIELFDPGIINLEKITEDELFNKLNSKTLVTNPQLYFPKIKHLNNLFWFLTNLSNLDLENTKIQLNNEQSETDDNMIQTAEFFGYFKLINEETLFLVPTSLFEEFSKQTTEDKYMLFLENIGSDKTTRDCINIQLNDPIYDRISRQMIFNKLKVNYNIIEEKLSDKEISNIVNNVRYWFLDIKRYLL